MKNVSILFVIFLISIEAHAYTMQIELNGLMNSKKITATDASGNEGILVSKAKFDPGIRINYSLSDYWKVILGYQKYTYDFDNTDDVISGERMFNFSETEFGVRWIFTSSMAFRFLFTSKEDLGFELNASNQAVFVSDNLSYLSVFYDQILWLGIDYFFGISLGYEAPSNGSTFSNRTATRFGAYINMFGFNLSTDIKTVSKESDEWSYTDQETSYGVSYIIAF